MNGLDSLKILQHVIAIVILVQCSYAHSQDAASPTIGAYFGTGVQTPNQTGSAALQFGGQFAEAAPNRWSGVLFEGGYAGTWKNFRAGSGLLSINYLAQFATDKRFRILPIATGGYSRLFGTGNAVNFGVGLDYRPKNTVAVRLEVRDYLSFTNPNVHNVALRLGILHYIYD